MGMILLAGVGVAALVRLSPNWPLKLLAAASRRLHARIVNTCLQPAAGEDTVASVRNSLKN